MLIDFANIQEDVIPNMLGGQGDFCHKKFQDDAMKVMQGRLAPGASLGLHTHETNCEVIYIISGSGRVLCDGVYEDLPCGSTHYCPHYFIFGRLEPPTHCLNERSDTYERLPVL
jgi:uncharacterized cupin superfamily protein